MLDLKSEQISPEISLILGIFVLVELILKGFALWRAAKKGDKKWYIAILILNTLGIAPLIYLLLTQKDAHKS